jgi:hypothetical protein
MPLALRLAQTLGSTFKHCGLQASQFKCSFRRPLPQYRSWCRPFAALAKVVAKSTTRTPTNAALTSFGVRESRRLFAHSPKHRENLPLAIHVAPYSSQSSQAKWPLLSASHRKAAGQESSCVLSSSVALCSKGRAVVGVRQAKFWWQSVAFPVQLRNATKKRSAA